MLQKSYDGSPTLYLVPTPIGNLDDMTFRSIEILKSVSLIACEDTRTSGTLLKHFNIENKLISLNEQNEDAKIEILESELKNGKSVAIISDAGTPVLCDPGYKTVNIISSLGYNVVCLPGANAFLPALVASGLKPYPFMFYGFLNSKDSKRKKEIQKLTDFPYTMVFYEAPHRIKKTVENLGNILGNKKIIISREISKLYEEIYRGNIFDFGKSDMTIKGEFVIVVEGNNEINEDNVDYIALVNKYISEGKSNKEAINLVSEETSISKRKIYNDFHRGD